jgi:putative DNA methylase
MPEYRKKLIEVALPLEAINKESAREKSIRYGHPSTLHLWWARRPLAACRAVLFAQMVDDPSSLPKEFPTEEAQEAERQRLFRIIEELVKWDNTTNEAVLHAARVEIARSAARNQGVSLPRNMAPAEVATALKQYAPPTLDPFAGGGSIPLEAQRLGLEAHASDLNPVAVLINKALIEIPPKFAGSPPVNPVSGKTLLQREWKGAQGLAEDVRYYGKWMRDEAWKRIGYLYPKVQLPEEQGGSEATVIAWLWTHTVKCPNPACGAWMPLVRSFALATKKGKETRVEPVVNHTTKAVSFQVRQSSSASGGTINRLGAKCLVCGIPVPFEYVRAEGQHGRISAQMLAIVAEGKGRRVYLPPLAEHESIAQQDVPKNVPNTELPKRALGFSVQNYGPTHHYDLFTNRQLVALTTFSDLVQEAREKILADAQKTGMPVDGILLNDGGMGANAYADALATYLAIALDRGADYWSTISSWHNGPKMEALRNTFARQAIPMIWDFAEGNPFSASSGNWMNNVEWVSMVIDRARSTLCGYASQQDVMATINGTAPSLISTDPPYYDNVGYSVM